VHITPVLTELIYQPVASYIYLQAGIGTYTVPEIAKPSMAGLKKTLDMMLGLHLDAHIMGKLQ
jgi:hypothetical protein